MSHKPVLSGCNGRNEFIAWKTQLTAYFFDREKTDDTAKLNILPLMLSGSALQYFITFKDGNTTYKTALEKLEQWTIKSNTPSNPLQELSSRIWKSGESVDDFILEIQQLTNYVTSTDAAKSELIKNQIVNGLPEHFRPSIRAFMMSKTNVSVSDLREAIRDMKISPDININSSMAISSVQEEINNDEGTVGAIHNGNRLNGNYYPRKQSTYATAMSCKRCSGSWKLELLLYADATDIEGQEFELPEIFTLDMSMSSYYKRLENTVSSKGFNVFILPKGEFPHYHTRDNNKKIDIKSGLHTTIKLNLDQDEQFPDGTCIEPEHVNNIEYIEQIIDDNYLNESINFSPDRLQSYIKDNQNNTSNLMNWQIMFLYIFGNVYQYMALYKSLNRTDTFYYSYKETEVDCINQKLINIFFNQCNCFPSFLPKPNVKLFNMETCYGVIFSNASSLALKSECFYDNLINLSLHIEEAGKQCPKRCNIPEYRIVTTSVPWPDNTLQEIRNVLKEISDKLEFTNHKYSKWRGMLGLFYAYILSQHLIDVKEFNIEEEAIQEEYLLLSKMYQGLSNNLALVTIEGSPYGVRIYREPAYPMKNLLADFGGLLGLWSGVSVLTFTELIELLAYIILILHRKRKVQTSNVTKI